MANQFTSDFAKLQCLDIKTIIEVMEQSETVPTPICTPIYDGWLGLVVRASLVDIKLVSRVYKLKTKWEDQLNAKRIKYAKTRKLRTPKWLSKEEKQAIKEFYLNCPNGYHVDHIIPLQGKVS